MIVLLFPEMLKSIWIFDNRLWKKMMVYALPLLIAGLAGMTNETIDRILLKHLLPNPDTASSELGLYGAFYKLSIIMILFIQTFRFAAEPFFFAQEKEGKSKKIYADVMKYFTIITAIIFLIVTIFYDLIKQFIGNEYHDERGFLVVSILLLANLFLGIYYNLSIWYKLTEKTKYGAYLSIFGALITLTLNFILIPIIGFVGSAWATLACYFSMTVASFYLGKKYFPIPYNLKRIGLYLLVMLSIYLIITITDTNMWTSSLYLIAFITLIFILEKPKKNSIFKP
jgi:O-antigen/teichoic acid export membrane protein